MFNIIERKNEHYVTSHCPVIWRDIQALIHATYSYDIHI